jgi:hypothetical protein
MSKDELKLLLKNKWKILSRLSRVAPKEVLRSTAYEIFTHENYMPKEEFNSCWILLDGSSRKIYEALKTLFASGGSSDVSIEETKKLLHEKIDNLLKQVEES